MPRRNSPEGLGVTADGVDAIVATFSARLDALVGSWTRAIAARQQATPAATDAAPRREARAVLPELEKELRHLERCCEELRQGADEARAAAELETRVVLSIREGRGDLGRARARQEEYARAAEIAAKELAAFEAIRDTYEHAVTAIRGTIAAPPNGQP